MKTSEKLACIASGLIGFTSGEFLVSPELREVLVLGLSICYLVYHIRGYTTRFD